MGKSGAALGIIGMILAAGAIGFSFVVWNGQNTNSSAFADLTDAFNDLESDFNNLTDTLNNLTQTIVVGFWDALTDNLDFTAHSTQTNWLFEFGDNKLNNTDYISVSNINTRVTLLKSGWYRIHISVLLGYMAANDVYRVYLLKDGAIEFTLDRFVTSSTIDSVWHYIDSSGFVYSDGTNYIELNGYSIFNDFSPTVSLDYNQLTIEYVAM